MNESTTLNAHTSRFAETKELMGKEWGVYLTGEAELCSDFPCGDDVDCSS